MSARKAQSRHRSQLVNFLPTCQLHTTTAGTEPNFPIILTLCLEHSTQPDQAITVCTRGTAFATSDGDAGLDTLALGAFSPLTAKSDSQKRIKLGTPEASLCEQGRFEILRSERARLARFSDHPSRREVEVRHVMPMGQMFRYEDRLSREDLKLGETYRFHIYPDYMGTTWWCWGDLEGNLKDKKLSARQEGIHFENAEKPSPERVEEEGWTLGANPAELAFEDTTGDAEFEFVD
ncbi:MAG: hypothetical protein Q9188_003572 [Gyalolechia gomerana]